MKVRSIEELCGFIDKDLEIRKRELSTLKFAIDTARSSHRGALRRAVFLLIYSHWEGFFRTCATAYCHYVAHCRIAYENIRPNFIALSLVARVEQLRDAKRSAFIVELVTDLLTRTVSTEAFSWTEELDTRSNLDSNVLRELLLLIGIDHSPYVIHQKFLDHNLVGLRNQVAHGQLAPVVEVEFEEAMETVRTLLELFRNDVQNAAVQNRYMRSAK